MKQEYFVVVLAHSLRGRLRRVHIPHQAVYAVLVLALVGCFSVFGFVASYTRMALKVANYNALKRETDGLRTRYQTLLNHVNQTDTQLASLQIYAREVTVAFGIKQKLEGPADISAQGETCAVIRREPRRLRLASPREYPGTAKPSFPTDYGDFRSSEYLAD